MPKTVFCVKLQRDAEGFERPPLGVPAHLSDRVLDSISREAWGQWRDQQTRLINEYKIVAADPKARAFIADECEKFLFSTGESAATGYVPPAA